jgi:hypothetical protein
MNLMLIVVFFLFLIGILGTTLFSGKFYSCYMDSMVAEEAEKSILQQNNYVVNKALIPNKLACLNYGGEWQNKNFNFDTTM